MSMSRTSHCGMEQFLGQFSWANTPLTIHCGVFLAPTWMLRGNERTNKLKSDACAQKNHCVLSRAENFHRYGIRRRSDGSIQFTGPAFSIFSARRLRQQDYRNTGSDQH